MRHLQLYFQVYPIHVLTGALLKQIPLKAEASGRLPKWAMKLGKFDLEYHLRPTIKGQLLADFVVKTPQGDHLVEDICVEA